MKVINTGKKNILRSRIKNFAFLIFSIAVILSFLIYAAPVMDDLPAVKPIINFIDEQGINAGAFYYTDIEEFSIAELNMKNTIDYLPHTNPDIKMEEKNNNDLNGHN
jgi:hypothetical protein